MKVNRYTTIKNESGRVFLREISKYSVPDLVQSLSTPRAVFDFATQVLKLNELAEEEFWILGIDSKCRVVGIFKVSHGSASATIVGPREVYLRALLVGAVNIIAIHNHPSGDPTPSNDDKYTTKRLKDAGLLVGVKLVDHIIVGNSYYSFKQEQEL